MSPRSHTPSARLIGRLLAPVMASLVLLFVSATALASGATDVLKAKQAELTAIIQKPASPESDQALQKTFDALLDYETLARDSLGSEWEKATPEQRTEFQGLLRTLVQRAYTTNIRETLDYDIAFQAEGEAKGGRLVRTVATHKSDKRKEPLHIDYVAHQVGGSWRVFDIVTEGSSLVANYQSQFRRIIEKDGFVGLLDRMRNKAAGKS